MPNTPIVNAGVKYVNGLLLTRTGNKTLGVAAGAARDSSNTNDIILDTAASVNGLFVGANGVDMQPLLLAPCMPCT